VEGSDAATYFEEFKGALSGLLSQGPTYLSKGSLMFAIDDLEAHAGKGQATKEEESSDEEVAAAGEAEESKQDEATGSDGEEAKQE